MPEIDLITWRIRFLCTPANGHATGLDCSAVQVRAMHWRDHWAAFRDTVGTSWGFA